MNTIEQFEAGGSHHEVGLAIGRRFGDRIHRLFDKYEFLQERLLPFYRSSTGGRFYRSFLDLHRTRFPEYVSELEGMAQGAERPFEEIFLVNLRGECEGLMALEAQAGENAGTGGDACTDCLVLNPDAALIGHNEDGTPAALGNMYVVRAKVDGDGSFNVLSYPGFLPGNAFGFNDYGVMHTINALSPRHVRVGLGRHFIARSLLDARSLDDAVKRATVSGRAAGFNYNIGSISERRVVSIEVSPDSHHVHDVQGYYVHTNHYLNLIHVEQEITPSSRKRLERAQSLCRSTSPTEAAHVLALLGDQGDRDYPIHCDATPPETNATLCSVLFDLDARQAKIFEGHPVQEPERCIEFAL